MTFLEKYMQEHPEELARDIVHICCPTEEPYDNCNKTYNPDGCFKCWKREIPEEKVTWGEEEIHRNMGIPHLEEIADKFNEVPRENIVSPQQLKEALNFNHNPDAAPLGTANVEVIGDKEAECVGSGTTSDEDDLVMRIKDSGARREFATGAVRDIQEGKGRCDLLPLDVIGRFFSVCVHVEPSRQIFNYLWAYTTTGECDHLYEVLIHFCDKFKNIETMFLEVSKHFEEGAKKYGEYNWQKGIPTHCYIDSAVRHYLKYLRCDKDEPHDRAFVWNILCCIWTCIHKPELNDYGKKADENET